MKYHKVQLLLKKREINEIKKKFQSTSGSILYQAVATGDHFAWVLPMPLTACASSSISYKSTKISMRREPNFSDHAKSIVKF